MYQAFLVFRYDFFDVHIIDRCKGVIDGVCSAHNGRVYRHVHTGIDTGIHMGTDVRTDVCSDMVYPYLLQGDCACCAEARRPGPTGDCGPSLRPMSAARAA